MHYYYYVTIPDMKLLWP